MNSLIYLSAYNAFVLVLFGLDKIFAKLHTVRIPEKILLSSTLFLGGAGAITGMVLFHHKISKPSFRYPVSLIFVLQISALVWYIAKHVSI